MTKTNTTTPEVDELFDSLAELGAETITLDIRFNKRLGYPEVHGTEGIPDECPDETRESITDIAMERVGSYANRRRPEVIVSFDVKTRTIDVEKWD